MITLQNTEITIEEQSQYIKKHLYMTESPCGGNYTVEQIDKMIYLINNDWSGSGCHWHEWIKTVYADMIKYDEFKNIEE